AALLAAPPRETLMLRLAAEMGLRRGEVAQVHTDDVLDDLIGWSLVVHGKGGRDRVVPMPGTLARAIQDRPRGYLFPGDYGPGISRRGTSASASATCCRTAGRCTRCGTGSARGRTRTGRICCSCRS